MTQPPKLIPIASSTDSPAADRRLAFEISPPQVPFVHAVLDWLDLPIAYIDRDLRIRLCNAPFAQAMAGTREALIDRHALADLRFANQAQWTDALEHAMLGEARDEIALHAPQADLRARLLPQTDEHGITQGCLLVAHTPDMLSARELELDALLKALPTPASFVDRHLRFVYVNQAALDERGWRREDVIGQTIAQMNDPADLADIQELLQRALHGERVDYERLARRVDGSQRWISRTIIPRRSPDGDVEGLYLFGADIHALRTEAARLAAQQAEIRAFLDALPLPLAYLDGQRRFALANQAFRAVEAREDVEVLGARAQDALAGDLYALIADDLDQAYAGKPFDYVHHGRDSRWRRVRLVPHRAQPGDVVGLFVMSHDIHEQRIAQIALERREQQVRAFSDNIPQPLAYVDAEDRVAFANKAFASLFNVARADALQSPLSALFSDAAWTTIAATYARAKQGETLTEERLLPRRHDEPRWIEMRWWPEFDDDAHATVRGVYLLCLDVHEARQARAAYEDSINQMRRAMNSIGTPIGYVDAQQRLRFANVTMQAWSGMPAEVIADKHIRDILGESTYRKTEGGILRALGGEEVNFEREFELAPEEIRWARIRLVPERNETGAVNGFFVAIFDVHDLKTQQRELQVKQEELRRANWMLSSHLENSPLAAIELDADLNIRRWSEQAERLFGWTRAQVLNRSLWDLQLISDGESDAITRSFALVLAGRQQRVSTLQRMTRHDGGKLWSEWYISALSNGAGAVTSIFALVQDVNQRIEAEARLQQLAAYDSLTNLPNRSSLQFELTQALDRARRAGSSVAAIFIDLDHFKNVNDTLGHRVGDQLLLAVARIMKASVRRGDLVSRMGGDEFMIVIEHPNARMAAQHIANKILVALNQPIPVEGHMITIAASAGIAMFPDHGSDANILLKNADVAMYHAKELGKGRFEFYSEELAREREEQALLEYALRQAIASDQLALFYQPRVSLRDGAIEGAEALLRWFHPDLGEIPPKKFIRVAEETGLIFDLGTWVFRRACTQLKDWEARGLPIRTLSINFSARQLLMRDLADRVAVILAEVGCDARKIEVEITETSMLFDVLTTKRVVTALKRLGLRIAIDDFGTGFSSLSHLQQLDIDALKVDQTFVRDLLVDAGDAAITRAVIGLGRGIGLQVIAEGVENARQLAFLKECGCDLYQGFHFSPAINAAAFEDLMRLHLQATAKTTPRPGR